MRHYRPRPQSRATAIETREVNEKLKAVLVLASTCMRCTQLDMKWSLITTRMCRNRGVYVHVL